MMVGTNDGKFKKFLIHSPMLEPIYVKKARETPNTVALRIILSWMKWRGFSENQRLRVAKTFFNYHAPKNS